MDGKSLVLAASGVARLARRAQVRPLVRGAEGATGVEDRTLHRSLLVAVVSVGLEEALAVSGMEDGSGRTGTERGRGIDVHRHPEEIRRLREHRGVTESVVRRGTDGHCHCLVRVHRHVVVGSLIVYLN